MLMEAKNQKTYFKSIGIGYFLNYKNIRYKRSKKNFTS